MYPCLKGQWRNDVFNEWGAIVNCSGDICDGLWINGSPADTYIHYALQLLTSLWHNALVVPLSINMI